MPDMNAPQLTPEDIQAIQQAQQAQQIQEAQQAQQIQEAQSDNGVNPAVAQPAMQPQQPAQPTPEELEMARKLLGIEEIQRQAQEAQEKLKQLEMERTKAQVMAKYPDVPIDLVEQEISKVEQTNPQLAEAMKLNPDLMEIAVKAVLASVKPNQQPDNITQGAGTADVSPEDEMTEKVKKGQADMFTLGDYILNLSKKK